MNEAICVDISKVERVLLHDGWHVINPGSFEVGYLAFVGKDSVLVGPAETSRIPYARWREQDNALVSCPLSSMLAIRSN
jgi:hypothetical protein